MSIRNKKIFASISFSLLIFFLISFLIYPLFQDIRNISKELNFKKRELILLENRISNSEDFQKIKPDLKKIEDVFVEKELPVDFISFLENLSRESKVSIEISSLIQEKEKDFLLFQIKSIGSFPNFLKFLEKIENSKYLVEIQNLNISRLSPEELKSKEFEGFSSGDIKANFPLKVLTK